MSPGHGVTCEDPWNTASLQESRPHHPPCRFLLPPSSVSSACVPTPSSRARSSCRWATSPNSLVPSCQPPETLAQLPGCPNCPPPPNSVGSGFTQDVPGARSPAGLPVASPGPLHRCSPPQSMFTHTEAHTCRVTERLAFSTWMSQKRDLPSRVALTWNDIVKARVACALLSCVREMGHMLTQELLESAGF